jgi:hypothetical protein
MSMFVDSIHLSTTVTCGFLFERVDAAAGF